MELTWLSNILRFLTFFIVCKEVLGQNDGKCFREYETESSYKTENVIYVCTNASIPNYTDVLYMDTAKVPRFQFSSCSCTVTFAEDGHHSIKLDFKHDSDPRHSLIIDGFNTEFSEPDVSKNVVVTKENIVHFLVNSTSNRRFRACLRVSLTTEDSKDRSLFAAKCESPSYDLLEATSTATTLRYRQISEITTENYFTTKGSSSLPIQDTTNETPNDGISGVVIGTVVGGIVFIVGFIIIVVIVVKIRRKTKPKDSHYFTAINRGGPYQPNQGPFDHYDEIAPDTQTSTEKSNQGDAKSTEKAVAHDYTNIPISFVNGAEYSSLDHHIFNPADHGYNSLSESKTGFVNQVHTYYNSPAEFKTNA